MRFQYVIKNQLIGTIYVAFFVEVDGKISGLHVVQSVNPLLNNEGISVLGYMPNWKPVTCNGESVRSENMVVVPFKLKFREFVFPINLNFRWSDTKRLFWAF